MHNVKIRFPGPTTAEGSVEIDGKSIQCRRIDFSADIHSKPTLIIELTVASAEIEASATVFESKTSIGDVWRNLKMFKGE